MENNNQTEIWKEINDFEEYEISSFGNVRNKNTKKILTQSTRKGYLRVVLYKNGQKFQKSVHRLVAEAFVFNPDPEHKTQVGHKDETRNHNHADNLEWVTNKENCNMPLYKQRISSANTGRKCTEETKDKISKANKRHYHSDETKEKISHILKEKYKTAPRSFTGKTHTDNTKQKMREAKLGKPSSRQNYHHSEETRKKISEIQYKPVICVETQEVFPSIKHAAEATKIQRSGIGNCCNHKQNTSGGYHWEFVNSELQDNKNK